MRSLRSVEVLISLAVLACFVLLGWLDYRRELRSIERYDTFSSYDYQQGGYHAWYDLLQREGIRVTRFQRRPAYLRDPVSTLVVANNLFDALLRIKAGQPAGFYSDADFDALRAWAASGGRLVWLVDQATPALGSAGGATQKLRRYLGGDTVPSLHIPTVSKLGRSKDAAVSIVPSPVTDGVHSVWGSGRLRLPFGAHPQIVPLLADATGAVVASYPVGKGSIIVVTDEALFDNSHLSKADNARLAYNLAAAGLRPGDTVAFEEWTHGYQSGATWWSITPWTLRLALGLAGGALLLLLLGATWRFGPAARLPDNTERSSQEYLLSMASLLDRGGAARKAIHDLAQIALHAAARAVGLPDSAPASSVALRLRGSEAGDARAGDLMTLERLAGYQHPTQAELVLAACISRDIRKELSFDGSHHIQPRRGAVRRPA